jgi:hypothetical protein
MSIATLLLGKRATNIDSLIGAPGVESDSEETAKTIAYEMDLHIPCRVSGITRNGSRWEGKAMTARLSSFGVHLMLPSNAELDGDIFLFFKVPAALRMLFEKKRIHAQAEIRPAGAPDPELESLGRKLVYATFPEPLKFKA